MMDWKDRLTQSLEPVLKQADPRPHISAYHDMPYAIFQYPPEAEFALRREVSLLTTRLAQAGKRVTRISLAECMYEALAAEGLGTEALVEAEKSVVPKLRADVDACRGRQDKAIENLLRMRDGQRVVRLRASDFFQGGIETEEQLEAAITGLKERCAELIGAGKKVLVQ